MAELNINELLRQFEDSLFDEEEEEIKEDTQEAILKEELNKELTEVEKEEDKLKKIIEQSDVPTFKKRGRPRKYPVVYENTPEREEILNPQKAFEQKEEKIPQQQEQHSQQNNIDLVDESIDDMLTLFDDEKEQEEIPQVQQEEEIIEDLSDTEKEDLAQDFIEQVAPKEELQKELTLQEETDKLYSIAKEVSDNPVSKLNISVGWSRQVSLDSGDWVKLNYSEEIDIPTAKRDEVIKLLWSRGFKEISSYMNDLSKRV